MKGVSCWDQLDSKKQASFLAYEQIREYEEIEEIAASAGAKLQ